MYIYKLTEIGFDETLETEESLIAVANYHCKSYGQKRKHYLPINTVDDAIKYFTENAFEINRYKITCNKNNPNELETVLDSKIKAKKKTYNIIYVFRARYTAKIETTETDTNYILSKAFEKYSEANFGEAENIDGKPIAIEDQDGNRIWEA